MPRLSALINFGFQTVTTCIVLFCINMLFALFDYQGGFPNFIGLFTFKPLFALIISFITICVCLIIGLPIRFHSKIHSWWKSQFWIPILGAFMGFISIILSLIFMEKVSTLVDENEIIRSVPNIYLAASGWFLISFCLMHFYIVDAVKIIVRKFNFHI